MSFAIQARVGTGPYEVFWVCRERKKRPLKIGERIMVRLPPDPPFSCVVDRIDTTITPEPFYFLTRW